MNKVSYVGIAVFASLMLESCSKDVDVFQTSDKQVVGEENTQSTDLVAFTMAAQIEPWQEHESLRTLSWDIENPLAKDATLVPKVRFTQEEFNGEFAPSEDLTEPLNNRRAQYYVGNNVIDPQYTEVSVKLRRPSRDNNGSYAKQYRYTVWNGRDYASGVQGGKGKVILSEANGKQQLQIYLPMAKQNKDRNLVDGDWFMAVTLGGHTGGYNHEEGMYQYYGPSANGSLVAMLPTNQVAYSRFGVDTPSPSRLDLYGWHQSLTEPNRYHYPAKADFATYFGLVPGSNTNPSSVSAYRKGVGLKEQVTANSTIMRNFPMMSRFYPMTTSKPNQYAAVGDNGQTYGKADAVVIRPRGTVLAFKLKNSTNQTIKVKSVWGNHGGKLEKVQAKILPSGGVVIAPRSYKSISYQGFYVSGFVRNGGTVAANIDGGFPEADLKNGADIPFVGMSMGAEEFPLISKDDQEGITLQPGEETEGRFYLWFTAEQGAELKIRMTYSTVDASGVVSPTLLQSKPQKVNSNNNQGFDEGKVYGALIEVKPV